ncbi:hypothetical protein K3217_03130 [bacterium BD-1]|nr:hypothetical protein [Ottowia caeni]
MQVIPDIKGILELMIVNLAVVSISLVLIKKLAKEWFSMELMLSCSYPLIGMCCAAGFRCRQILGKVFKTLAGSAGRCQGCSARRILLPIAQLLAMKANAAMRPDI